MNEDSRRCANQVIDNLGTKAKLIKTEENRQKLVGKQLNRWLNFLSD